MNVTMAATTILYNQLGDTMRLTTVNLLAFYLFSIGVAYADITSNLISWWKFDDRSSTTAVDSSGNGNNGTLTNDPTWTTGMIGSAISFDGVDDVVSFGPMPSTQGQGQMTWAFWVYATTFVGNNSFFVGKSKPNMATEMAWAVFNAPTGWRGTTRDIGVYINGDLTSNDTACFTPSQPLTDAQWNHVVVVFDGTLTGNENRLKIYVNGSALSLTADDCTGTIPTSTLTSSAAVTVGNSADKARAFKGVIDEVRIYSRSLSSTDVAELYNYTQVATTK
jgi:hypothetical protein